MFNKDPLALITIVITLYPLNTQHSPREWEIYKSLNKNLFNYYLVLALWWQTYFHPRSCCWESQKGNGQQGEKKLIWCDIEIAESTVSYKNNAKGERIVREVGVIIEASTQEVTADM